MSPAPEEEEARRVSQRDKARCREVLLFKAYHALVEKWNQADREACFFNQQILRTVSESYFKDIERKKAFHGIEYADAHKRAAYMVKWIMKFRPVQLVVENASPLGLLANEHYALYFAIRFLKIRPSAIPPHFYYHLIYSLHYRYYDANSWAMKFYLMEQLYGDK